MITNISFNSLNDSGLLDLMAPLIFQKEKNACLSLVYPSFLHYVCSLASLSSFLSDIRENALHFVATRLTCSAIYSSINQFMYWTHRDSHCMDRNIFPSHRVLLMDCIYRAVVVNGASPPKCQVNGSIVTLLTSLSSLSLNYITIWLEPLQTELHFHEKY